MLSATSKIGFIGGGKIAHAMAQGFIAAGERRTANIACKRLVLSVGGCVLNIAFPDCC